MGILRVDQVSFKLFKLLLDAMGLGVVGGVIDLASDLIGNKEQEDTLALIHRLADRLEQLEGRQFARLEQDRIAQLSAPDGLKALLAERAPELASVTPQDLAFLVRFVSEFQLAEQAARFLDPKQDDWDGDEQLPSYLLNARYRTVPFSGRDQELSDVAQWCDQPNYLRVRLYTGGGGMGKTRLFQQIAEERRTQGWTAAFLYDKAAGPALERLCTNPDRLFLVLDYAEMRGPQIAELAGFVKKAKRDGRQVRLILLARGEGDWLANLQRDTEGVIGGPAFQSIALAPYSMDENERAQAFKAAQEAFREKLGFANVVVPPPDLSKKTFERILFIHMAALAAAYGKTIESGIDLLDFVLEREKAIWAKQTFGVGEKTIHQATALMTLAGAVEAGKAEDFIKQAPLLQGQTLDRVADIATKLHALYPGPAYLNGVQPDLLGEHLVARSLGDPPNGDLLAAAFDGPPKQAGKHALTVLDRMAAIHPQCAQKALAVALAGRLEDLLADVVAVAQETGGIVGDVAARLLQDDPQPAAALAIVDDLPHQSVALRHLSVIVTGQALGALPGEDEEANPHRARLLSNLSVRLSDLGDNESALAAIQEAAALYRELARRHPDAFRPDLATSLNNLSAFLSDLGDKELALAASREAVAIRRELAQRHPDAFRPDLAMSLNNLSGDLSALGDKETALAASREAVEILAPYFLKLPMAFANNMAIMIRGYVKTAEAAGQEPDHELLGPVVDVLGRMRQAPGDDGQEDTPAPG